MWIFIAIIFGMINETLARRINNGTDDSGSGKIVVIVVVVVSVLIILPFTIFVIYLNCLPSQQDAPRYGENMAAAYYKPPGMDENYDFIPPDFPKNNNYAFFAIKEFLEKNNNLAGNQVNNVSSDEMQ